jgi:hypothetical protein
MLAVRLRQPWRAVILVATCMARLVSGRPTVPPEAPGACSTGAGNHPLLALNIKSPAWPHLTYRKSWPGLYFTIEGCTSFSTNEGEHARTLDYCENVAAETPLSRMLRAAKRLEEVTRCRPLVPGKAMAVLEAEFGQHGDLSLVVPRDIMRPTSLKLLQSQVLVWHTRLVAQQPLRTSCLRYGWF